MAAIGGIAEFTMGCEEAIRLRSEAMDLNVTEESIIIGQSRDKDRERRSVGKAAEGSKKARKAKRLERTKANIAYARKEGVTYKAGGF